MVLRNPLWSHYLTYDCVQKTNQPNKTTTLGQIEINRQGRFYSRLLQQGSRLLQLDKEIKFNASQTKHRGAFKH